MTASTILVALALFQVKHLVADFWLQTPWIVGDKSRYGHAGGLLHAGLHVALNAPILIWLDPGAATVAAILAVEFVVHYHVDWLKAWHTKRAGLTSDRWVFWATMGVDQAVHQATYLAILWWLAVG